MLPCDWLKEVQKVNIFILTAYVASVRRKGKRNLNEFRVGKASTRKNGTQYWWSHMMFQKLNSKLSNIHLLFWSKFLLNYFLLKNSNHKCSRLTNAIFLLFWLPLGGIITKRKARRCWFLSKRRKTPTGMWWNMPYFNRLHPL